MVVSMIDRSFDRSIVPRNVRPSTLFNAAHLIQNSEELFQASHLLGAQETPLWEQPIFCDLGRLLSVRRTDCNGFFASLSFFGGETNTFSEQQKRAKHGG